MVWNVEQVNCADEEAEICMLLPYQKIRGYANQLAKDMMSSSFITTEEFL